MAKTVQDEAPDLVNPLVEEFVARHSKSSNVQQLWFLNIVKLQFIHARFPPSVPNTGKLDMYLSTVTHVNKLWTNKTESVVIKDNLNSD